MKSIIGVVVLAAVVGGVFVLNDVTRRDDGKSLLHVAPEVEVGVEVATAERRRIIRTVQAPGDVEAIEEVDISSEVVGKIVEMPVEEGDYVHAGDLLCRLDDVDYRARVVSAEANIAKLEALKAQAEADMELAERNYEECQRLRESGAMTVIDYRNAKTALIKARKVIEMREKELIEADALRESARDDLEKTVMRAPIAGIISQRFADPGEVVITGTMNNPGTRIMVITDLSQMQVRCRVDEADAPLVKPDQPARIFLQSDTRRSIEGRVLRVGTKGTKPLGRDIVTFETLVLIIGDDPRVKPGMTANVEIEVAERDDAITVPIEAVVYRKRRDLPDPLVAEYDRQQEALPESEREHSAEYIKVVFCEVDDRAEARLIETGISDVSSVEIVDGIGIDDRVIIGPYRALDQLKDGRAVRRLEEERSGVDAEPGVDDEAVDANAPTTQAIDEDAEDAGESE